MNRMSGHTLGLAALVAVVASLLPQVADAQKPRVVVLNLKPLNGVTTDEAEMWTQEVVAAAFAQHRFSILSQIDAEAHLGKAKLDKLLGCAEADNKCRAEILILDEVKFLLYGTIGIVPGEAAVARSLTLNLLHVPTGTVPERASQPSPPPEFRKAARIAVEAVLGGIERQPDPPPPFPLAQAALIGGGLLGSGLSLGIGAAAFGGFESNDDGGRMAANAVFWTGAVAIGVGVVWLLVGGD